MRRIVLAIALAALVVVPVQAEADYFQSYEMDVDIGEHTRHEVTAVYVEEGADTASIEVEFPESPQELVVTVNGERVEAQAVPSGDIHVADVPITPGTTNAIEIAYTTTNPSADSSQGRLYRKSFRKPVEVRRYGLTVTLPAGATIVLDNDVPVISPDAALATDGQRITLEWNAFLRENQAHTAVVVYDTADESSIPLIASILASVIIIYGIIRYRPWKRTERRTDDDSKKTSSKEGEKEGEDDDGKERVPIDSILDTLNDNEKAILDVILRFDGKAMQKDIVRELDFSKSKVSKVLRGLEMKGVIEKKPYGRTNILQVAEKYVWED